MESYGKPFRSYKFSSLIKLKTFFLICKYPKFVSNLGNIYNYSNKIIGKKNTNSLIKFFYGDLFVGGENSKELEKSIKSQAKKGIICIADYAREFLKSHEENVIKK
jgi:hypothetical protein